MIKRNTPLRVLSLMLAVMMLVGLLVPGAGATDIDPGGGDSPTYKVTVSDVEHGSMEITAVEGMAPMSDGENPVTEATAAEGALVRVVVTADPGYVVSEIIATPADGGTEQIAENTDSLEIIVPASDVTVTAVIAEATLELPTEDTTPPEGQDQTEDPEQENDGQLIPSQPENVEDIESPSQNESGDANITILDSVDFSTLCLYFEMNGIDTEIEMDQEDVARLVYANDTGFVLKFESAEETERAYNKYLPIATKIASVETIETPQLSAPFLRSPSLKSIAKGTAFTIDMNMAATFPTHSAALPMKGSLFTLPFTSADGNSHNAKVGDNLNVFRIGSNYAYCIQPNQMPSGSLGVQPYEENSTEDGTGFWVNGISDAAKEVIRLTLVYGYPNVSHGKDARIEAGVTQLLVWEFAMGYRQAAYPYGQTNSGLYDTINWDAVPDAQDVYNEILSAIQLHGKIPSFTYPTVDAATAGTDIKLTYGSGKYSQSAADSNGVLGRFTFAGTGLTTNVSGSTLNIESQQAIGSSDTMLTATGTESLSAENARIVVFDEGNVYNIPGMEWYDNGQTLVSLYSTTVEPLNAYVRVTSESFGSAKILKTSSNPEMTEKNSCYSLEGAVYGLYSDSICSFASQVGTFTTKANGESNVIADLTPGKYYVKEITASKGYLLDTTVHEIEVKPNETASITCPEEPDNDPIVVRLNKVPEDAGTDATPLSLEGAEFTVTYYSGLYATEAAAEAAYNAGTIIRRTWTLTTRKVEGYDVYVAGMSSATGDPLFIDPRGNQAVIPHGTIVIKEKTAPAGYVNDPIFTIGNSTQEIKNSVIFQFDGSTGVIHSLQTGNYMDEITMTIYEPSIRGGVKIAKVDAQTQSTTPQGDASLASTKFDIISDNDFTVNVGGKDYSKGEVVMTLTTSGADNSASTAADALPYGSYHIVEKTAPTGYAVNTATIPFSITENNKIVDLSSSPVRDTALHGSVELTKVDADSNTGVGQGDADLSGAEFTIYNNSAKAIYFGGKKIEVGGIVTVITTDASGNASVAEKSLPYGSYKIKETKAPTGYLLNSEEKSFTIRTDGQIAKFNTNSRNAFADTVIRGGYELTKVDSDRNAANPQGDATLEGAVYAITNNSTASVYVNGEWYEPGAVVMTLTTDENGYATTGAKALPYGSYSVAETDPSTGYLLSDEVKTFTIRTDGQMVSHTIEHHAQFKEKVIHGGIELTKRDADTKQNIPQGDAVLSGAEFTIYNDSENAIYFAADSKWVEPGEAVMTIVTDRSGYASTGDHDLPYGTYSVKETKAPLGYTLDEGGVYEIKNIKIREDGKIYSYHATIMDKVWRGGLMIQKRDLETGLPVALGSATLSGAEFTVYNSSNRSIEVKENGEFKTVEPGEIAVVMITDKTGVAKVDTDTLPYGTYTVKETGAPQGYFGTDTEYTVEIKDVTVNEDGYYDMTIPAKSFYNQVMRGDFEIRKIDSETQQTMKNVTFRVTSLDEDGNEIESHEFTTDANGYYSTRSEVMDQGDGVGINHTHNTNGGQPGDGIWFGVDSEPDDTMGALPYGLYKIEELEGENNKGKVMWSDEFFVYRNNIVIEFNNIENHDKIEPEMETTLRVGNTADEQYTVADGVIKLTDTIYYDNFDNYKGKEVTFTGTLMDAETGEPITDADGNPITASTTKKVRVTGTVQVTFEFDVSELDGKTVVAFEKATIDVDGTEEEIASHEDLNDKDQTVYFPEIRTTATDKSTGNHMAVSVGKVTIVDTVTYSNLEAGKTYTMTGKLLNKANGNVFLDKDGNAVTATKEFKAEAGGSGTVEIEFVFETADTLPGTVGVAAEEIPGLAVHADLEDEDQTVYFPELQTSAAGEDGTKIVYPGPVVIRDTVTYKNLIAGNTYRVAGQLMDKSTGKPIEGAVGETVFTAENTSGTVVVELSFDGSAMAGKTLVVFEKGYLLTTELVNGEETTTETEIAHHEDLEDENQTIRFPGGQTTLLDSETEDHIALADESVTLIDTISYNGLVPGKAYTAYGVLMDKNTGEAVLVNGEKIEASAEFTPETENGTVEVTFKFDGIFLAGTSVVAFEAVYDGDTEVFVHADITDESQTVNIPGGGTVATDAETETHETAAGEKTTIKDVVYYTNLIPGKEYKVTGVLMNAKTGKPLMDGEKEISAEKTFTPDEADGTVELEFTFDSSAMAGDAVVAFETVAYNDIPVFVHADLTDEYQTVVVNGPPAEPEGSTTLLDSKTKTHSAVAEKDITLVDTISYKNLTPGTEYTVYGVLMDKETGKRLLVNDKEVWGTTTFTPTEPNGTVDVIFQFDGSALVGKTVVAFEGVYEGETEIFTHEDINDENQSVTIIKPVEVVITKTDLTGAKTLPGAVIVIYDSEGKEVFRDTTDKDGVVKATSLKPGDYTFKEITAPDGYRLNEETFKFTIHEDGTVTGDNTIKDAPEEFEIFKFDADTNKGLAGAKIKIYDKDKKVVYGEDKDHVSNKDGKFHIPYLPAGDYTFVETSAPSGYERSRQTYAFTVKEDGTITGTLRLPNKQTNEGDKPTPSSTPTQGLSGSPATGNIHWSTILLIVLIVAIVALVGVGTVIQKKKKTK